ncbi:MAG: hypothetical protein EOO10_07315 [Chitinophagaceae bacterium]|nr:MAG: hypothetical protein EOO10_07315 [Chitinophagaceae bacterium]
MMDYTHPKLFKIASRKTIIKSLQQAFTSKGMKTEFDSMSVIFVSPAYNQGTASYRKVVYFTGMRFSFSDSTDLKNQELAEYLILSFEAAFPGKKAIVDAQNNAIKVSGSQILFAIKDSAVKDWMFLEYDQSNPQLNRQLFPKQVQQHFNLL